MRPLYILLGLAVAVASSDYTCTRFGYGVCQDWRFSKCIGGYERGKCSGDANRRCCKRCTGSCSWAETRYSRRDYSCRSSGGTCMHETNFCNGHFVSGKCAGPSSRKCCLRRTTRTSGRCDLMSYSASLIRGHRGMVVKIHPGFKGSMDRMNGFAAECRVTVWVTNAFRKQGQDLHGAIVPPATKSNHLVGHAIDFNLQTPYGLCNSRCMTGKRNSYSNCFINKVVNSGLRYGGNFRRPDPVHIDDGLNYRSRNEWNRLFNELQRNCQ